MTIRRRAVVYFVCTKNDIFDILSNLYLLLTEFEGRTVCYEPSFPPLIYGTRLVKYLLYLYSVCDGFVNDFYSRGTASNF